MTLRRRLWWAVLLGALIGLAGSAGVPLYDGVGFPDEPYRFVRPPAGVEHGPPAAAVTATVPLVRGTNQLLGLQSEEQGPQLALSLPAGAVRAAPTARRVTVSAIPLAPEEATHYGPVVGNVYRLAATSDAGPVDLADHAEQVGLALRAPAVLSQPVGVFRPGAAARWTRLDTGQAGADLYTVAFRGAGEYALVEGIAGEEHHSGAGSSLRLLGPVLAAFVVLLLVIAVLARTVGRRPPGQG